MERWFLWGTFGRWWINVTFGHLNSLESAEGDSSWTESYHNPLGSISMAPQRGLRKNGRPQVLASLSPWTRATWDAPNCRRAWRPSSDRSRWWCPISCSSWRICSCIWKMGLLTIVKVANLADDQSGCMFVPGLRVSRKSWGSKISDFYAKNMVTTWFFKQ